MEKKPVEVLHVLGTLDRGGAETMIMELYRNIDKTKVQFNFVIHTEDRCDYETEIMNMGGRIHRLPKYKLINHWTYKRAWKRLIDKNIGYKIVHGHMRSTASIYLNIAKKKGLKTIAHSHSVSTTGKRMEVIVKNILQYQIRHVSEFFFACSKTAGKWLFGEKVYKSNNFFVLNNAIDVDKFSYDESIRSIKRKELGLEDNFVVGHVGRFVESKNHEFILEVFKNIHKNRPNSVLLLVGDGELKEVISKKCNAIGLQDKVMFVGARSDVPELLQAMDTFIFPSFTEGLGLGVIESQCAGLKSFASDVIPEEAKVTELLEVISLRKNSEFWASKILSYEKNNNRTNASTFFKNSEFDIKNTSNWIENFYISISDA